MKRLLTGLIFLPFLVSAQTLNFGNPFGEYGFLKGGKSIYTKSDVIEEGNYWFPEQPALSNINLSSGKYYTNIKAIINLKDNELLFLDSTDQMLTPNEPVSIVDFHSAIFKKGFPSIDGLTENNFYQVLAEGNLTLLKAYKISYIDKTPIERSTPVRIYSTDEALYIYDKNKMMRKIRKRKKDIIDLFKDKTEKVEAYIQQNKLNLNSESDVISVIQFYNTL